MAEDSEQEISELDIESRTWNKLETTMKLFGFREGAVKGKGLSLQEGFNLGYLDGFKLGETLGLGRAIINCESELVQPPKKAKFEEALNMMSSQPCVKCVQENIVETTPRKIHFQNLEDLTLAQHCHSNKIITALKTSGSESFSNIEVYSTFIEYLYRVMHINKRFKCQVHIVANYLIPAPVNPLGTDLCEKILACETDLIFGCV